MPKGVEILLSKITKIIYNNISSLLILLIYATNPIGFSILIRLFIKNIIKRININQKSTKNNTVNSDAYMVANHGFKQNRLTVPPS